MAKARVPETDQGIQGDFEPRIYNQMQRRFRDKGWMETKAIPAETGKQGHGDSNPGLMAENLYPLHP